MRVHTWPKLWPKCTRAPQWKNIKVIYSITFMENVWSVSRRNHQTDDHSIKDVNLLWWSIPYTRFSMFFEFASHFVFCFKFSVCMKILCALDAIYSRAQRPFHNKKKTNLHIYESDEEHENEQRERRGSEKAAGPIPGGADSREGKRKFLIIGLIGLEPLWSASW